jgi:hypothetical protein
VANNLVFAWLPYLLVFISIIAGFFLHNDSNLIMIVYLLIFIRIVFKHERLYKANSVKFRPFNLAVLVAYLGF